MATRTLESLFRPARDQYAATGRRAHLAVLALILFHAAIVTPWVESERQRSASELEKERFAALDTEVTELGFDVGGTGEPVTTVMKPALEELIDDLRQDFSRLEATRRSFTATGPGAPVAPPGRPQLGAASIAAGPTAAEPFGIDDPEWIAALSEAGNRYGLLAALDPIAEALVVKPRFADLNRTWKSDAMPLLETRLDALTAKVARLGSLLPEAVAEWGAVEAALTDLRRTARDLELRPPEQPYWWASPESAIALDLGLSAAIAEQIRRPLALDELDAAVLRTKSRQIAVAARLEHERARALADWESRQRRLAGFGGLLAGLGVDLPAIATLFPFLLGLLLAAVLMRRSRRLYELGLAAHLAITDGASPALDDWCLAQLGGDPAGGAEGAWRAGWLRAVGVLTLALGWIALAAVQVRELPGLAPERWLTLSIAGAAAVLIATVHRLIIVRRAVGLAEAVERPSAERATSSSRLKLGDLDEEPEIISGHTWRR